MPRPWIAVVALVATLSLPSLADTPIGQPIVFHHPPLQENGHLLIPVRELFESLGGTVNYDAPTQTVTTTRGNQRASMTVGHRLAYLNGQPLLLDTAPVEVGGTALVPLEFAAQAAGVQAAYFAPAPVAVSGPVYYGSTATGPVYFGSAATVVTPAPLTAPSYLAITSLDPDPWTKVKSTFTVEGKTAPFAIVRVTEMGGIELTPTHSGFLLLARPRDFLATADENGDFSVPVDAGAYPPGSRVSLQVQAKDAAGVGGPARALDLLRR